MRYSSFDPMRYTPNPGDAAAQGKRDLARIAPFLTHLTSDSHILDVGCGCGNLLLALKQEYTQNIKGLDISIESCEYGKSEFDLNIYHDDWYTYMKSTECVFDVVIALDVLEHLPSSQVIEVLKATRKRLRKRGRLILRTPNALCPLVLPLFCGDITHKTLVTPELLKHLLREAGFSGTIDFAECTPFNPIKRFLWNMVHHVFVKPAYGLAYYHFHHSYPRIITRNFYCCAVVD